MTKAYGLTAMGIIGSVPPPGCGGSIDCSTWAGREHLEVLENPESVLQDPTEEVDPAPVICDDVEWGPVARILVGRRVLGVGDEEEIATWQGKKQ